MNGGIIQNKDNMDKFSFFNRRNVIKEPNFFFNKVFKNDFDSLQKLYNTLRGGYFEDSPYLSNQDLLPSDVSNLKVIDDPLDPTLCSVSFYGGKNLTDHNWSSFSYPRGNRGIFDSYLAESPPSFLPIYFIDVDGHNTITSGRNSFDSNRKLRYVKLEGVITLTGFQEITWKPARVLEFPNALFIANFNTILFDNWRSGLDYIYLPKLEVGDPSYAMYFNNWCIRSNENMKKQAYFHPDWETANGGSRHASIDYMISKQSNTSIRYVTNFDKPNAVNDLTFENVTGKNVTLNFTPPTINTNENDFYEVWLDDGTNNIIQKYFNIGEVQGPGETIQIRTAQAGDASVEAEVNGGINTSGLLRNTTYKIKLKTVDYLYNKSGFSNEITITTTL